jgi:hypothetical protein
LGAACGTLYATQVGKLAVPASTFPLISSSPNDHVLYYIAYDANSKSTHLWVYDTDATGAPQNPPVQTIDATAFYSSPASKTTLSVTNTRCQTRETLLL